MNGNLTRVKQKIITANNDAVSTAPAAHNFSPKNKLNLNFCEVVKAFNDKIIFE